MPLTLRLERLARRCLAALDAWANRLYGWRYNPLYQSGTIVVALLIVLIVTGIWLLLFYRVGAPWDSVARITASPWVGNWVRGLHRYASDAALVATAVHALRMLVQARSWGPRTLAWASGIALVGIMVVTSVTGFIMVWDTFGHALALETARLLDALPVLSESVSRAFVGERPVPSTFFFLNLFAHSALPLAIGVGLWIHVSRLARPVLLPPMRLAWTVVGLLALVAVAWPLAMAPEADPFTLPESVPTDWFYGFWLPLSRRLPAGVAWLVFLGALALVTTVPWLARRRGTERPTPSVVDPRLCTACNQCVVDCPWEAITLVLRTETQETRTDGGGAGTGKDGGWTDRDGVEAGWDGVETGTGGDGGGTGKDGAKTGGDGTKTGRDGRGAQSALVALVNPARCVGCGICAGSCAPMGVGPAGLTGRAQLDELRGLLATPGRADGRVLVLACEKGAAALGPSLEAAGAECRAVPCAGNLHTSVIELAIRVGAPGVLILSCPPRDCAGREGPRWLHERLYEDREAELQPRVDRRRVRLAYAGAAERAQALAALAAFQADLALLEPPDAQGDLDVETVCVPASLETEEVAP